MKKQSTSFLLYTGFMIILFLGCKKNDSTIPSSLQSFTEDYPADYNADVRGMPTAKATAEVPLAWYKLAITLTRFIPYQGTGPIFTRGYGYIGLALYESVVP